MPKPQDSDAEPEWVCPPIQVKWGSYFAAAIEEQKPVVDMVIAAKGANLVDQRQAVEQIAPIFKIENVDAYLETLEEEQQKNDEREIEKTGAEAQALHKAAAGVAGASKPKRPPGGAKSKKPASG
jgi:hypothetical protein